MVLKEINYKNFNFTLIDSDSDTSQYVDGQYSFKITIKPDVLKKIFLSLHSLYKEEAVENIKLTKREKEVIKYIAQGKNNTQIAHKLNVSVHTAKMHVHKIFGKLSVKDRTEAAVKAIKYHLI